MLHRSDLDVTVRRLALALAIAPAIAQTKTPDPLPPIGARAFLPKDYVGEIFTDYERLRQLDLLGAMERQPMVRPLLDALADEFGATIDDLDRVRTAVVATSNSYHDNLTVSIAEGPDLARRDLAAPWTAREVGPFHGFGLANAAAVRGGGTVLFWPRPGTAVQGHHELLQALATGTQPPGDASEELRWLRASDDVVLFQVAFTRHCDLKLPFYEVVSLTLMQCDLSEERRGDYLGGRFRLSVDADGNLWLAATWHFRKGSRAPLECEAAVERKLQRVHADPDKRRLREYIEGLELVRKPDEFTIRFALGEPRTAIRRVERAVLLAISAMEEERR